jgi:hypothetical protein
MLALARAASYLVGAAAVLAPAVRPAEHGRSSTMPAEVTWLARRGRLANAAVAASVNGALRRLARPDCGRVLDEFADAAGTPLTARLRALGLTPAEYVGQVVFADGVGQRRCADSHVLAVTSPGSRAVFVCPQFSAWQRRDTRFAEAIVIHEVLHTLGLRENPPSSREVTRRVLARCGG